MKKLVFILALIFSLVYSYSIELTRTDTLTDSIEIEFSFPTTAFNGEYGAETDDEYIYTSQYFGDSLAKYDLEGNLIEKFTIPGVGPMHDLTYDGEFIYGGSSDYFFYVVDMQVNQLIVKWDLPKRIGAIAFESGDQFFYVSETGSNKIYWMDASGFVGDSILVDYPPNFEITGLACPDWYSWFDEIWIYGTDSLQNPFLLKYDTYTNQQVGYPINLSSLVNPTTSEQSITGGLYISRDIYLNYTISGVITDQMVFGIDMDYANLLVETGEELPFANIKIWPNPANSNINISGEILKNANYRISDLKGNIYKQNTIRNLNQSIDVSEIPNGVYFLEFGIDKKISIKKKIIIQR